MYTCVEKIIYLTGSRLQELQIVSSGMQVENVPLSKILRMANLMLTINQHNNNYGLSLKKAPVLLHAVAHCIN